MILGIKNHTNTNTTTRHKTNNKNNNNKIQIRKQGKAIIMMRLLIIIIIMIRRRERRKIQVLKEITILYNKKNNDNINDNSPGQRPIGVLDPVQGCVSKFPDRAKWAPQGPRRRKLVPRGRAHLPPISLRVMPTCYLRWILSTHSRSSLKMQGSEPPIDLDFRNVF